jgi:lipoprotein-releasing system ATP-binding protein
MADGPVLEARGLRKVYGQGEAAVEALRGVDLSVQAGEFLAILGPSGSGKSTLLNLLGLMDRPSAGEVRLFGERADALPEEARAALRGRRLGFVFQFDSLLPEFTLLENVLLPARIAERSGGPTLAEAEVRARELLLLLDILPLAHRLPAQLSGGERQRGALARALVNRPAALLADEPTGNLDRGNGELVFSLLGRLSRSLGVAVVTVTHNEDAARAASRAVRIADGRVA